MKAFIIHLPERPHSLAHAIDMKSTLTSYGLDAELHVGVNGTDAVRRAEKDQKTVYPYSIKTRALEKTEVEQLIRPELWPEFQQQYHWSISLRQPLGSDEPKMKRPGVIGCFYSHYGLWKKCVELDEPIMIFEDDVKFYRGWYPVDWEGVLILSLGKSSFLNEPYKTYLENPSGAPQPMPWSNFSMPGASGYAIKPATARKLAKFYRNYYYPADNAMNKHTCTIQIHNYIMGRNTLPEEGNISMTKCKDWQK